MWYRIVFAVLVAGALCVWLSATLSAQANDLIFPGDENWDPNIGSLVLTHTVHSLAFDQGYLYLGEGFGDGNKHIRRWDGANWQSIAANVDGSVLALVTAADGKLYAGGYFTQTGSCNPCKRVAVWDGTGWSPVGNTITGEVTALAIHDNKLYAGVFYEYPNPSRIKRWDGTGWINEPITDTISEFVSHPNGLFAAGKKIVIDEDSGDQITFPSLRVKRNDGWHDLGSGFANSNSNSLFSLAFYPSTVFTPTVGGDFIEPPRYLLTWSENGWTSIGKPDDDVLALAADSCGGLYVGGEFRKIENENYPFLAYYDGTDWHSLGDSFSPLPPSIEVLRFYHGYLAVGGVFTQTLGSQKHRNIALWIGRDCHSIAASGVYTFYAWRQPVVIEIATPGNLAQIRVQRFNRNHSAADEITHPNLRTGVYWQIEGLDSSGNAASGMVYTLTLPTVGFTPDAKDKICHYTNLAWDCAASRYDATRKTITRGGLTSFSDFTVGNDVGPTAVRVTAIHSQPARSSLMLIIGIITGALWIGSRRLHRRGSQAD